MPFVFLHAPKWVAAVTWFAAHQKYEFIEQAQNNQRPKQICNELALAMNIWKADMH